MVNQLEVQSSNTESLDVGDTPHPGENLGTAPRRCAYLLKGRVCLNNGVELEDLCTSRMVQAR
jgi:hypothetical protein